jgi:TonB family protein
MLVGVPWWHATPSTIAEPPRTHEARRAGAVTFPEELTWVDLAPAQAVSLPTIPGEDASLASEDHAARDRGQQLGRSVSPSIAIAAETLAPAADHGENAGRLLDPAFRRDSSTLHARLTDGSTRYRPEHERTGKVASSPDATRKEKRVGTGDSSRTRHHAVAEARSASSPDMAAQGEDDGRPPSGDEVQAPRRVDGEDPVRGAGALDAEPGDRQFDITALGPARDTRWVRAASDEKHPGLMDLSAVSSPGPADGRAGRGPGEQPGVVNRAAPGTAPSLPGDDAMTLGDQSSRSAAERVRSRYEIEIRQRVARALRFPRNLALLLEQGESIVAFTIGPDGRLEGEIRLLKSAGFDEFDAEAKAAVARAAPFPPTGRSHAVSMRVPFENPVVR